MKNQFKGYQVVVEKRAQKALDSFDAHLQEKIFEKLEELVAEQHSLNIKMLKGYDNLWRIKFGDYRIVFEPEHKIITVYIVWVGTRQGVYQKLKQLL